MPSPPIPKMKYVGINLTKYVQGLYEEDYKTLRKYIKDKMSKWRDIYSWLKRLSIFKMLFLSNLSYRFNTISIKIL